jgi:hypothetical protein
MVFFELHSRLKRLHYRGSGDKKVHPVWTKEVHTESVVGVRQD